MVYEEWWLSGYPSNSRHTEGAKEKTRTKSKTMKLLVSENLTRGNPVIPDNTNKNYALTNLYPTG